MKTKLLLLCGAALCLTSLSSCVTYDEYGYYDDGYAPVSRGYYSSVPVSSSLYVDDYYGGYGYGYGYPGYSNVFLGFGGRSWPWGSSYYRDHDHHHHDHGGHHHSYRSSSGSSAYASRVARPSSFRTSSSSARPTRSIPSVSVPRGLSRPSPSSSVSRPSGGFSAPSRSLTRPSSPSRSLSRPSTPSFRSSAPSIRSAPSRSMSRPSPSLPSPSRSMSRGATTASFRPSASAPSGRSMESRRSR